MLACVIFGSLISLSVAVYGLILGMAFGDAFALYLAMSVFGIVCPPVLCAMRRQALRRWQEARHRAST